MLFIAQSDLLHFFIGTLKAGNALVIDPYPNRRFGALLNRNHPIFMGIHSYNIVSMPLHEYLLSSVNILSNENAPRRIVDFIILEDDIWIMEGTK
jgi:hypothetical protein